MLARVIADVLNRLRKTLGRRRAGLTSIVVSSGLREVRLRSCGVVGDCHGACCARGVRIDKPEAERLAAFVRDHPEHFRHLADPERALVPLDNLGTPHLWHTEVVTPDGVGRNGLYRAIAAGETVTASDQEGGHCVFKLPDGRCSFQVAAVALGHHKWEYKPTACWLFPLKYATERSPDGACTYRLEWIGAVQEKLAQYPCSRRASDGAPAADVLREEIEYFYAKFGPQR
jgi:hypothetical protein